MIESGGQSLPEEQQGLPDETRRGNRMRPQGQPPENGGKPGKLIRFDPLWPNLFLAVACLESWSGSYRRNPREQLGSSSLMKVERGDIQPMRFGEVAVEQFIHLQNLEHFRRLLVAPDQRDEPRRQMILKLLADEMSKDSPPQRGPQGRFG